MTPGECQYAAKGERENTIRGNHKPRQSLYPPAERFLDGGNHSISFVLNVMVLNIIPTAVEITILFFLGLVSFFSRLPGMFLPCGALLQCIRMDVQRRLRGYTHGRGSNYKTRVREASSCEEIVSFKVAW